MNSSRPSDTPVHYFQDRELSHPASLPLRCDFAFDQDASYLFHDESSLSYVDYLCRINGSRSDPLVTATFKFKDKLFGTDIRVQVKIRDTYPRFTDNIIVASQTHDLIRENTLWIITVRYRSLQLLYSLLRDIAPSLQHAKPWLKHQCLRAPSAS